METRLALHVLILALLAGCSGPTPAETASLDGDDGPAAAPAGRESTGPQRGSFSWDGELTGVAAPVENGGMTVCNVGLSTRFEDPPFEVEDNATLLQVVMTWDNTVPQSLYLEVYDPSATGHKVTLASPLAPGRLEFTAERPAPGTWSVIVCVEGAAVKATFHAEATVTYP
jgi:hypothetical protein